VGGLLLGRTAAGGLSTGAGNHGAVSAVGLALALLVERVAAAVTSVGVQVVGVLLAHDVLLEDSGRLFRPHVSSMAYSVGSCKS
jgi:hypothetical protein